jgi:hypothetical protein
MGRTVPNTPAYYKMTFTFVKVNGLGPTVIHLAETVLVSVKPFHLSVIFVVGSWLYPEIYTMLERPARDKHSSL